MAIDDFIGGRIAPAEATRVWAIYDRGIHNLAAQGAVIVVLPEKIEVMSAALAAQRYALLSAAAQRDRVYLAAGVALPEGDRLYNRQWLFGPDGGLLAKYDKRHLVPGLESELTPGGETAFAAIGRFRYGLAICKDLHFPSFGRIYGQQGADVLIDLAWDFGEDAWISARLSAVRGIESGFAIIRSSREGLMGVTDRYGRIAAELRSAPAPGNLLVAEAALSLGAPTFYARFGDVFGWSCVALAIGIRVLGTNGLRHPAAS